MANFEEQFNNFKKKLVKSLGIDEESLEEIIHDDYNYEYYEDMIWDDGWN